MFGSLDCMHWTWKNCPIAWGGAYAGRGKKPPTIILEAVATQDLWIWHCFFGMPGSFNDINVLDRSPFVAKVLAGQFGEIPWTMEGKQWPQAYLLTDGIYPDV